MAYDLTALRNEVTARGFDYLSTPRIDRFLNDSMHMIDDLEPWSYLLSSATGTGPEVVCAGLSRVVTVRDTTNNVPLVRGDFRSLGDEFGNLALTGSRPLYYYVATTSGTSSPVIGTFPSSTVGLTVLYCKISPDLASGADVPLMPDRFRYAIVEYAVAAACRDVSNYAESQAATQAGDAIVGRLREWDLLQGGGAPAQAIFGDAGDW